MLTRRKWRLSRKPNHKDTDEEFRGHEVRLQGTAGRAGTLGNQCRILQHVCEAALT